MPDPDDRLRQGPKVYPLAGVTGGRLLLDIIPNSPWELAPNYIQENRALGAYLEGVMAASEACRACMCFLCGTAGCCTTQDGTRRKTALLLDLQSTPGQSRHMGSPPYPTSCLPFMAFMVMGQILRTWLSKPEQLTSARWDVSSLSAYLEAIYMPACIPSITWYAALVFVNQHRLEASWVRL